MTHVGLASKYCTKEKRRIRQIWQNMNHCWVRVTFFKILLVFVYFGLYWVFSAARALLWLWRVGVTLQLWCAVFSCCRAWALGLQQLQLPSSRAHSQWLWHTGLLASRHVGSFRTRDRTHVSCISRWILYHWAAREAPEWCSLGVHDALLPIF